MLALYRCRAGLGELRDTFRCQVTGPVQWPSLIWPRRPAPIVHPNGTVLVLEEVRWGMAAGGRSNRRRWTSERHVASGLALGESEVPPGRCIIPMDSFAFPAGVKGRRSRDWFGLWDQPVFGWAGLTRNLPGHGLCFIGMETRANALVARSNQAMPLILDPAEYDLWLTGPAADLVRLGQRPYPADRMWREETDEAWVSGQSLGEDPRP